MPLADITNPDVIKFLVESYDKTTRLRQVWNSIHGERLKKASVLTREEKGYYEADVLKNTMVEGITTLTRDYIATGRNRRSKPIRDSVHINTIADLKKGHSIPEVGLGDPKDDPNLVRPDTDLSLDPVMRPIHPKQKAIIYKVLPVYGRDVYLKSRCKIKPETKYYFTECSGWQYGWRINDSYFKRQRPAYGRVWSFTRNCKSRTGPQPDPSYYKDADQPALNKCVLY